MKQTLLDSRPDLATQWHPVLNGDLFPNNVTPFSHRKAWWLCANGHEWLAEIANRSQGRGCPYCAGKAALQGFNDLATTHPELSLQWDDSLNDGRKATDVTAGSEAKAWWRCSLGHQWEAVINSRTSGSGCPVCSGRSALPGFNDLATTHPELAKEWDVEANGGVPASAVVHGSRRKANWSCSQGHKWTAAISNRSRGRGCPYCANKAVTPGFNDLATTHPALAEEWDAEANDGLLASQVVAGSGKKYWWRCSAEHSWRATGASRVGGSGCPFCSGLKAHAGESDLETLHPELALSWNKRRNGMVKPSALRPGSNVKVWWTCALGHEWESTVVNRVMGRGCPYCTNKAVLSGFNDLATTHPGLAYEWDSERNRDKNPENVIATTSNKFWWICKVGHPYQASGEKRIQGTNCPYCAGSKLLVGFNDLATRSPQLALEWHPVLNGSRLPHDVSNGTQSKAWWVCSREHEWQASISSRVSGVGCPYCTNRTVLSGFNDLATTNPTLAAEWDVSANGDRRPTDVIAGNNVKIAWVCSLGHRWRATISSRKRGSGCPICAGLVCLPGFNDLETVRPDLAAQWHFERNPGIGPSGFTIGSSTKVWWVCESGHEWSAQIANRNQGRGCPKCANYGFNPEKPALFYFIKNETLKSRKVGITNLDGTRRGRFEKAGWETLLEVECAHGDEIQTLEREVLEQIRKVWKLPVHLGPTDIGTTGGWTETFSADAVPDSEIIELIENLAEGITEGVKR